MSLKKDTRMLTEHNSDGTHNSAAATTLKPLLAALVTQNAVAGSRAYGTIYRNTTGKLMTVAVSGYVNAAGVAVIAYTDSSTPPTTEVARTESPGNSYTCSLYFLVLPNNYYKVDFTSGVKTLSHWTEWY